MIEVWKKIEWSNSTHEVSNMGRVRSLSRSVLVMAYGNLVDRRLKGIIKKPYLRKDGYMDLSIRMNPERRVELIHRLVAVAFIPNPLNKPCVNHIDGNKSNNNISNLEWCTHSENALHAHQTGLMSNVVGSNTSKSKLTEDEVMVIKIRILKGDRNLDIAKMYNVDASIISCIRHNKIWKHVTVDNLLKNSKTNRGTGHDKGLQNN